MTIDVEDYFQVSAFTPYVSQSDWDSKTCRVEANVDLFLQMLSDHNVKATFFMLGWIAERYPSMVRRAHAEGHEIASHGWWHQLADRQDPKTFSDDVGQTKDFLENLCGEAVTGYRAPSFSINASNLWAHDVLQEQGYRYSSSIAPIEHDIYGWPQASRFPFPVSKGRLLEIPISTVSIARKNVPCGGGGWFRLFPYAMTRSFVRHINRSGNRYVFYCHPWEFDPDQPRIPGLDFKTRFRHYVNQHRMEARVKNMLDDFKWGRMDEVFATELNSLDGGPAEPFPLATASSF